MNRPLYPIGLHRHGRLMLAGVCTTMLLLAAGCPNGLPGGNGSDNGPDDNVSDNTDPVDVTGEGEILSLKTNFTTSTFGSQVSIAYTIEGTPDTVAGFWVQIGIDGQAGDPVVVDADLSTEGAGSFNFEPSSVEAGTYQVGILITFGGEQRQVFSDGTILVEGPPDPRFIQPTDATVQIEAGETVLITFDAGDPENDVAWRLFYLVTGSEAVPDSDTTVPTGSLGTEIEVSQGRDNAGAVTFETVGLSSGNYQLGLSATDSGASVVSTSEAGLVSGYWYYVRPFFCWAVARSLNRPPRLSSGGPGLRRPFRWRAS